MIKDQFITKYRPEVFDQVLGNEVVIKQLREVIKSGEPPHGYFLSGPTGVGKTTLARIIAKELNCFVEELDAASNSGVDDTRHLVEKAGFTSVMGTKNRMYIIDECHNISKKGFEPLLKLLEDPPPYLYIALCTTEPSDIPKTIHAGRVHPVPLKPLKQQEIETLIEAIASIEEWKLTDDVFAAIVQAAEGSARKALSLLKAGHSLQTRNELAQIVVEIETADSPALALANYLLRGGRAWDQVKKSLDKIDDYDVALIHISRSFANAMSRGEEKSANAAWRLMECIVGISSYDAKVKLYSAIGRIVWSQ